LRTPDAASTSSDAPHAEQNLASSGFARPHDTQVTTCEGCRYETCRCKTRVRLRERPRYDNRHHQVDWRERLGARRARWAGLPNLREAVVVVEASLGGELRVASAPGKGTGVEGYMPVNQPAVLQQLPSGPPWS
jgi:hypothetical protein